MAKPKQPLLSLGAHGTIGDALTFQKRGQDTIVRQKPIPKDPYSLNQAYQRWDYRDYAYLWTLLSNTEKQVYRTKASRYHITGFSQWMREKLNTLPDIAGRWHLDEKGGAIAYDSSKNQNHGTIFGASPTSGIINGAFHFDGIDNKIVVPDHPTLDITDTITFETRLKRGDLGRGQRIFAKGSDIPPLSRLNLWLDIPNRLVFGFYSSGVLTVRTGPTIADTLWHHVAITYDQTNLIFYVDEVPTTVVLTGAIDSTAGKDLYIGIYHDGAAHAFNGDLDEVKFNNQAKDSTEIQRHSERRYP